MVVRRMYMAAHPSQGPRTSQWLPITLWHYIKVKKHQPFDFLQIALAKTLGFHPKSTDSTLEMSKMG
jgi:hypothetical protein